MRLCQCGVGAGALVLGVTGCSVQRAAVRSRAECALRTALHNLHLHIGLYFMSHFMGLTSYKVIIMRMRKLKLSALSLDSC